MQIIRKEKISICWWLLQAAFLARYEIVVFSLLLVLCSLSLILNKKWAKMIAYLFLSVYAICSAIYGVMISILLTAMCRVDVGEGRAFILIALWLGLATVYATNLYLAFKGLWANWKHLV